ncbi:hypothetical protein EYF80_044438 [Liparis tanakae]|uniref:Uncharacterized protein n=1 Tax=Liparis tanakae TaxID=230148 RepID=A0A4Z2FYE5_9TELE|nr:hypothetical protein EYF80_044438 [Liparis tanakae]
MKQQGKQAKQRKKLKDSNLRCCEFRLPEQSDLGYKMFNTGRPSSPVFPPDARLTSPARVSRWLQHLQLLRPYPPCKPAASHTATMPVLHVTETQRPVEATREFNPLSSHRPFPPFLADSEACEFTSLSNFRTSPFPALLHLPDGDLSVVFAGSAEDVAVFRGGERRHLVVVAVQLLQDLVALCVQDVDLAFGGTAADTADPYLERNGERLKRRKKRISGDLRPVFGQLSVTDHGHHADDVDDRVLRAHPDLVLINSQHAVLRTERQKDTLVIRIHTAVENRQVCVRDQLEASNTITFPMLTDTHN